MRKLLSLSVVFIYIQMLHAQTFTNEYGKVSNEDFQYTSCPYDKTAEAVVLFDKGESRFVRTGDSFQILYGRTTRIKILSQAGVKWAEVEIPYYQSNNVYEKVYNLEAIAYNFENGILTRSPLNLNNTHEEKVNEHWNLKKFAIPNVKPGTVIEYKYFVESEYVFNLRDWDFQWKIPVLYSEYKVSLVPFYQYTFLLQGATRFDEQTSVVSNEMEQQFGNARYKDMIHTYKMKNLPAFKDEEFITSPKDYMIKMDFQLSKVTYTSGFSKDIITTWPLLIKDLLDDENFGKYMSKSTQAAAKIFNPQGLTGLSQQQKFDSVINYVKKNYSWNKYDRLYASKSVKAFMNDKFGNSAEINLFTTGLLKKVGIDASPVLISTRDHGKIKYDYPFVDFFNYVGIRAVIDSTIVLSDATDVLIANNRIPVDCINDKGLIVQKNKIEWVRLHSGTTSRSRTSLVVELNDTLSKVHIKLSAGDYDGVYMRKEFGTDIKLLAKYFSDKNYNVADSTVTVKNMVNYSNPYSLMYTSEFKPEHINNKLYISPFFSEVPGANPLKQQTRTYPIDMTYSKQRTFTSNISIPAGYEVESLPAKKLIRNPLFEMEYNAFIVDGKVNVSFSYFFKQPVYDASEYDNVKAYYNEIISKANEKIVFAKK